LAPGNFTPDKLDEWYKGSTLNMLPNKARLAHQGLEAFLTGWLPEQPIIGKDTRVIGVGSCFASYFLLWLAENGFNRQLDTSPHNALVRYGAAFENPAVIAQQFRWAFEGLDVGQVKWIAKDKELFEASEERRLLVRRTLEQTDVLVLTLGLSEVWYDSETGEPLWRALTKRHYDPQRHVFRVEKVTDTIRWLEKIESIRARHLPSLKIVFTVSPVRLSATFRPISAISANSVSKAILRAGLDEFLRSQSDKLNRLLYYFPSFEIVQDYFRDPFEEDNRHVTPFVAAQVVRCFAENFCDTSVFPRPPRDARSSESPFNNSFLALSNEKMFNPAAGEHAARVAELEGRVAELQRIADERMQVIDGLDRAARERLELVQRLDAECARLRQLRSAP
jgi:hypothetical protein